MAQVSPSSGSIIVADWHRCKDSKEYFSKILHKKRRKNFGLLESPVMPPHVAVDTVHYKIFLSGKSGVGKTALAARLAGLNIPNMHYETTGRPRSMRLWDCGENALRRFDHLLPACKEQVDAVLFLFSFTDRTSFDDLSNQIAKWTGAPVGRVVKLVVGTKFDLFMHCDVAERDVRNFQETWSVPVLRVGGEVSDGLGDVASLLNCLAEHLWHQDCVSARRHSQQETGTVL
ncbi:Ciliogenesis and planar polarity effector 2 [Dissostichus eleginoides]|uniref:Ciliogenesis and planar polarity effector 2 n=1 Tax=Dissostichus eleginoides TaxID=100907 RepID=A0AAD9FKB1_DISEL|nr:Ciliogenesis and planar polarity effector 2 [Dissostichus eleginoides]